MNEDDKNMSINDVQNEQSEKENTETKQFFTQEEVNRLISERLKREKSKYADYAELKKAAEELQKLKEAQMSEAEKLQAKLAEYEQKLLEYAELCLLLVGIMEQMGGVVAIHWKLR